MILRAQGFLLCVVLSSLLLNPANAQLSGKSDRDKATDKIAACRPRSRDKPLTATVSANQAKFIVPVGKKAQWDWNVEGDGTQGMKMDYRWAINVDDMNFGFYHWSKGQPQTGNLHALLAAGDVKGTRSIYNQARTYVNFASLAGVSVQIICDNVAILVKGKDNVGAIFSARPQKVKFIMQQPGKDFATEDVPVTYQH